MALESAVRDSNSAENEHSIDRARALCAEALEICDALELSPEIGARLHEIISALEESSRLRSS